MKEIENLSSARKHAHIASWVWKMRAIKIRGGLHFQKERSRGFGIRTMGMARTIIDSGIISVRIDAAREEEEEGRGTPSRSSLIPLLPTTTPTTTRSSIGFNLVGRRQLRGLVNSSRATASLRRADTRSQASAMQPINIARGRGSMTLPNACTELERADNRELGTQPRDFPRSILTLTCLQLKILDIDRLCCLENVTPRNDYLLRELSKLYAVCTDAIYVFLIIYIFPFSIYQYFMSHESFKTKLMDTIFLNF